MHPPPWPVEEETFPARKREFTPSSKDRDALVQRGAVTILTRSSFLAQYLCAYLAPEFETQGTIAEKTPGFFHRIHRKGITLVRSIADPANLGRGATG